eukprot:gnl/TRDRNA2_/TRDRNA2_125589_c0_seq1.p1 gnl/TRDRNA2_/TRDRNA2_125589_c0~~gnl/TRDRNA2_/TRDRNA2_125589_c0_seq1.p1  ORF type:complete len:584 (-),score=97.32 gnl/TRDRNA2_/TRDRNA2_125589_c0_seq1:257-1783(-)
MTAAGFPWMFVGAWLFATLGGGMPIDQALLVARFAAPTSAGILFSMLDAAGLKESWVFQKARILAIFDDLDTILLMIPLKVLLVGFKFELVIAIAIMSVLLALAWFKLHMFKLPHSWQWTLFYALAVAIFCKMVHYSTHHWFHIEPIHIEVLLPAFVLGTVIDTPAARHELQLQRTISLQRISTRSALSSPAGSVPTNSSFSASTGTKKSADDSKLRVVASASDVVDEDTDVEAPGNLPPGCIDVNGKKDAVAGANDNTASKDFKLQKANEMDDTIVLPTKTPSNSKLEAPDRKGSKISKAWSENEIAGGEDLKKKNEDNIRKASKASAASSYSSRSMTRYGASLDAVAEHHGEDYEEAPWEDFVQTSISLFFMVLVGLSMPALIGKNSQDQSGGLGAGEILFHVIIVSLLMILGKMFPVFCYRDEANLKARAALCLGMCPRGEVGASIIVISLQLGITGPSIIVAMCALGGNLVMSGVFIMMVKYLLREDTVESAGKVSTTPVVEIW